MAGAINVQSNWFSCPLRKSQKKTVSFRFPMAIFRTYILEFEELQPWPIHWINNSAKVKIVIRIDFFFVSIVFVHQHSAVCK